MSRKNIILDNKKINKSNFCRYEKLFKIRHINFNKILVSEKEPYGKKKSSFKYLIGYNNNDDIRPLCINHLQMTEYAKYFEVIRLSFKVSDKKT